MLYVYKTRSSILDYQYHLEYHKNDLSIHQNKCTQKVRYNTHSDNHVSSYTVSTLLLHIHPYSCKVQDAGNIPMLWEKCLLDLITS